MNVTRWGRKQTRDERDKKERNIMPTAKASRHVKKAAVPTRDPLFPPACKDKPRVSWAENKLPLFFFWSSGSAGGISEPTFIS